MKYKTCPTCDGQGHVPDDCSEKVWFTITPANTIKAFASEEEARDSDCRFAFADEESLRVILEENPGLPGSIWCELRRSNWDIIASSPGQRTLLQWIWLSIQPLAEALR